MRRALFELDHEQFRSSLRWGRRRGTCQVVRDRNAGSGGGPLSAVVRRLRYITELPIPRLYADARMSRIYGSTSEVMKAIIAKPLGLQ